VPFCENASSGLPDALKAICHPKRGQNAHFQAVYNDLMMLLVVALTRTSAQPPSLTNKLPLRQRFQRVFLTISLFRSPTGDTSMFTTTTLAFVALAIIGLALIHETRLRRLTHNVFCRLIRSLRHKSKGYDHARDGK
jgi:hypothetical protein